MQYHGRRFRAECRIAGKVYGRPFGVDVAFGDPLIHEPELVIAEDVLDFAGVPPPTLRIYPVTSHIAEKLHAFTLPRNRPNSRVKDLPDIALLATAGPIVGEELRTALQRTFEFRATHDLPATVPAPPSFWEQPYTRMATEDELPWANLADVESAVSAFLDPALASEKCGRWSPDHWVWET